jgi:hypothetical protein
LVNPDTQSAASVSLIPSQELDRRELKRTFDVVLNWDESIRGDHAQERQRNP